MTDTAYRDSDKDREIDALRKELELTKKKLAEAIVRKPIPYRYKIMAMIWCLGIFGGAAVQAIRHNWWAFGVMFSVIAISFLALIDMTPKDPT